MKKILTAFIVLNVLLLSGCGKEEVSTEAESDTGYVSEAATDDPTVEQEIEPVKAEGQIGEVSANGNANTSEKQGEIAESEQSGTNGNDIDNPVSGIWHQTDEDEEITTLNFKDDGTYTYTFDYTRAYEESDDIDEDPISGESEPRNYFLDEEYVIELADTTLIQINMSMDENLSDYGNCGIYDSAANAIYIGDSFNNLLMNFEQQGHTTQGEWLEYIENEFYLTFVR